MEEFYINKLQKIFDVENQISWKYSKLMGIYPEGKKQNM